MERKWGIPLASALVFLNALAVFPSPVAASQWCGPLQVYTSPTSGYQNDVISFSVTLTNGISNSLDVTGIAVVFQWSSTTWDWGTMSLSGYASDTNTYSVTLPSNAGDYTVHITVTGQAVGDWWEESCGPFTGTFRVLVLPPPPSVVATANPTTGSAPLSVSFTATASDGLAPLSYQWSFGDGDSSSSQSPQHTYDTPGTYTAHVVVTDSRGRSDSDSVTVTVGQPTGGDILGGSSGALTILLLVGIALVVVVVLAVALRGRRMRVAQAPVQPPMQPYYAPPAQPPSGGMTQQPPTQPPQQR